MIDHSILVSIIFFITQINIYLLLTWLPPPALQCQLPPFGWKGCSSSGSTSLPFLTTYLLWYFLRQTICDNEACITFFRFMTWRITYYDSYTKSILESVALKHFLYIPLDHKQRQTERAQIQSLLEVWPRLVLHGVLSF